MDDVTPQLIEQAVDAFDVVDIGPIGAPGGQKAVRHVERDGLSLVLKVVQVGSSTSEALRRAEREVELLAKIRSPHVVKVESELVELGDPVQGAAWLEEFLDGEDLSGHLFIRQWTWDEARLMGEQVAEGLATGHEVGVVHRDLSANNVRKMSDGTYKVLDFGFARHTLRSGLTLAGQPGTPGYASPEHLNPYSGAPMKASDVFCVGILMYAALAGKLPIPFAGDEDEYVRRLTSATCPDLASERPDLPPEAVDVVGRCLHPQPARRFRDGRRLADALRGMS